MSTSDIRDIGKSTRARRQQQAINIFLTAAPARWTIAVITDINWTLENYIYLQYHVST